MHPFGDLFFRIQTVTRECQGANVFPGELETGEKFSHFFFGVGSTWHFRDMFHHGRPKLG